MVKEMQLDKANAATSIVASTRCKRSTRSAHSVTVDDQGKPMPQAEVPLEKPSEKIRKPGRQAQSGRLVQSRQQEQSEQQAQSWQQAPGQQEQPAQSRQQAQPGLQRKPRFIVTPGAHYGFLTAIEPTDQRRNGYTVWRCRCDCGREYMAASRELKNKETPSCKDSACEYYIESLRISHRTEDLTGRRYGKLVVLGPAMDEDDGVNSPKTLPSESVLTAESVSSSESVLTAESVSSSKPVLSESVPSSEPVPSSKSTLSSESAPEQTAFDQPAVNQPAVKQNSFNRNIVKRDSRGRILWNCKCDCGNSVEAVTTELITGNRKSCGCLSRPPLKDWIGHRFGKLIVVSYAGKRNGKHFWKCVCDCGKETTVEQSSLKCGHTTSCGCQARPVYEYKTLIDGTCVENLRSALTRRTIPKNNLSGVRGVYWDKKRQKWVAQITFKGKTMYLGSFANIGDARIARKQAEERYFGEFLEQYDRQTTIVASGGAPE